MFAVIYSNHTGRIRWHTSQGLLLSQINQIITLPGEVLVAFDDTLYDNHIGLQLAINNITGIIPVNDRYIEIDSNANIVTVHILDPLIDTPPQGHVYVPHNIADLSWTVTVAPTAIPPSNLTPNQVYQGGILYTFMAPLPVVTTPKVTL